MTRSASVVAALVVALVGGLIGLLLFRGLRTRRRALAHLLLLVAASLGVAIGLAAVDSATYTQLQLLAEASCGRHLDARAAPGATAVSLRQGCAYDAAADLLTPRAAAAPLRRGSFIAVACRANSSVRQRFVRSY
jgi:hypothetical protein